MKMIIKFEDYINESTLYTLNFPTSNWELPIFISHNPFDINDDLSLYKILNVKNIPNNVDNRIYHNMLFEQEKEFIKKVITPYFVKLKLGIKNIIPKKQTDRGELLFDLRTSLDFYDNILKLFNNWEFDIVPDYDGIGRTRSYYMNNINNYKRDRELQKSNPNITVNIYNIKYDIIAILKHKITDVDVKTNYWNDEFNEFVLSDESIKNINLYIKES